VILDVSNVGTSQHRHFFLMLVWLLYITIFRGERLTLSPTFLHFIDIPGGQFFVFDGQRPM